MGKRYRGQRGMENVPITGPSSPPTSTGGHTESENPTTDTSARMSSPVVQSRAQVPVSNSDHRTWRSTVCRSGRYVNTTKTESTSPECTSPLCVHFVFSIALVHRARPMSCDCPLQVCQEDAQDDGHIFLTSTNDERGLCASAPRLQRKELTGQR